MAKARAVHSFRGESLDLEARIINAIQKVGPKNISLLSRMTGAHAETIRYKVKRQFKSLGFEIDAEVDYEKLGLSHHWTELNFSRKYRPIAKRILSDLNECAHLTYYGKVVPHGHYLCVFSVPGGASQDLRLFLEDLKKMGVLDGFGINRAVFSRRDSMMPAHFDFGAGRWDVDWAKVRAGPSRPFPVRKEQPASDLDDYDLMLMKELEADSLRHIVGIARKLRVHQKTLEYHYRAHVQKRKLISYYVKWVGEPEETESPAVLPTVLLFSHLGNGLPQVQNAVSKIPFLWWESLTENGSYIALLLTPVREAIDVFDYISREAPDLHDKVQVGYVKVEDSAIFAVPNHLYNRGWTFDRHAARARIAKLTRKSR